MLDIVSGNVLKSIMDGPASSMKIRSNVADFLEVDNDAELQDATDEILKRLENAALIEHNV